jgi:Protein of unknown function (DUF3990)
MSVAPPLLAPHPWTNQPLRLYHGTIDRAVASILSDINLQQGRPSTDFGQGFYTTTIERQAESWAWSMAQRRAGTLPAVIRYDVDRDVLAQLDCLWFIRGSFEADDFWSMIHHCRRGGTAHGRATNDGWYDVVLGPVAASWKQRLTIHDADQVSFHSRKGVWILMNSNPRRIL